MKKIVILTIGFLFLLSIVHSGDYKYVGYKRCIMCHKGEKRGNVYETWKEKKHAKAFESIKEKGKEKEAKCLNCHTTAFNKGGYKIGDAKAALFEGVGCEACHGPGSKYKSMKNMKSRELALQNGLWEITEKVCTGCHDGSEHTGKFNYKEALKAIDHTYRK